jgi:NAD+ synthase
VKKSTLDRLVDQDSAKISKRIERFISNYVAKSSTKGLVIGLSGGLDSSVVLKLSVNALGPSRVLGLVLPSDATPKEDIDHAIDIAKSLGAQCRIIDINPIIAKYGEVLPDDKKARGNLIARIRMSILYYHANINGYLVAGTSDKSELIIGYYTKFGDGGADIMPIADLYKTQVRALARFLEIPRAIVEKKSSPRLWVNHLAEEEIGMKYESIDPILYLLLDKKINPKDVAKRLRVSEKDVAKVKQMVDMNAHKRNPPVVGQL